MKASREGTISLPRVSVSRKGRIGNPDRAENSRCILFRLRPSAGPGASAGFTSRLCYLRQPRAVQEKELPALARLSDLGRGLFWLPGTDVSF